MVAELILQFVNYHLYTPLLSEKEELAKIHQTSFAWREQDQEKH